MPTCTNRQRRIKGHLVFTSFPPLLQILTWTKSGLPSILTYSEQNSTMGRKCLKPSVYQCDSPGNGTSRSEQYSQARPDNATRRAHHAITNISVASSVRSTLQVRSTCFTSQSRRAGFNQCISMHIRPGERMESHLMTCARHGSMARRSVQPNNAHSIVWRKW